MRYNMEELLQNAYEQKEKPTKEFCQSVIRGMKEKEMKTSFWGTGLLYNKMLAAAFCIGLILIAGFAVRVWGGTNAPDAGRISGQFAAETAAPVLSGTDPAGDTDDTDPGEDGSFPDDLPGDGKGSGEHGNQNNGGEGMYPENPSNIPSGRERGIRVSIAGNIEKTAVPKTPVHDVVYPTPGGSSVPETVYTAEPQPAVRTAEPEKPIPEPAVTTQPANAPVQPGDYLSLCSLVTHTFSDPVMLPEEVTAPSSGVCADEVAGSFWNGLLKNRMITSFDELEAMRQDVQKKAGSLPKDGDIQKIVGQLEEYDSSFFLSDVLCVNLFYLEDGYDLTFSSVTIEEDDQGEKVLTLNLQVNKTAGGAGASGKKYYGCFIQVPGELAWQCGSVVVRI